MYVRIRPQEIGNFVTQETHDKLKPLGTQEKLVDTTRLSREMWSTQKRAAGTNSILLLNRLQSCSFY